MFSEDDPIFRYTRAQAITDGLLIDLRQPATEHLVRQAGIRLPIAMTASAYAEAVAQDGVDLPDGQDINGRLWDVLMVLRTAIRAMPADTDRVPFKVDVWNGTRTTTVNLWALCGPGDNAEPCITILCEGED